jgi:hypothetical protein
MGPSNKIDGPNEGGKSLSGWRLAFGTCHLFSRTGHVFHRCRCFHSWCRNVRHYDDISSYRRPRLVWLRVHAPAYRTSADLGIILQVFQRPICLPCFGGHLRSWIHTSRSLPTSAAFIFERVITGCGAGIFPGTLTIIGYSVPKKQVQFYYGYFSSIQCISFCTSPIIGEIFTELRIATWCIQ